MTSWFQKKKKKFPYGLRILESNSAPLGLSIKLGCHANQSHNPGNWCNNSNLGSLFVEMSMIWYFKTPFPQTFTEIFWNMDTNTNTDLMEQILPMHCRKHVNHEWEIVYLFKGFNIGIFIEVALQKLTDSSFLVPFFLFPFFGNVCLILVLGFMFLETRYFVNVLYFT